MSGSTIGVTDPSSGNSGGTTTYTTVINGVTEVVVVQNTVTVVQASAGVGYSSLATVVASQEAVSRSESLSSPIPSTTSNGGGAGAGAVTSAVPVTSSEVPIGSTVVVLVTAAAQTESAQESGFADLPPNTPSSQNPQVASSVAGALSSTTNNGQPVSSSVAGSAVTGDSFVFPTSLSSSAQSSSKAQSSTLAAVLNEDAASSSANIPVHSATIPTASVASSSTYATIATITSAASASIAGSASNSSDSDVTYVYSFITLTGTAAAAAMAEAGSSTSTSSKVESGGGGSKLSSFAIVGIVAGVLVGLIVLYLLWYSWRKKAVQSKRQDMDLGDPLDEKEQSRPETMHSGFDFIDEPPSATSRRQPRPGRSTSHDPFNEERYSIAPDTETWYQDPNDVEYLSGNGDQRGVDDDGATALGENLHTGYTHSVFTTRPSLHRQMSEPAINPFVPPVPPLPSTYTSSGRRVSDSGHLYPGLRPGTTVSHAESVNYEDIYGGYADSRPGTFFVPDQSRDRGTIVEPATSTLLGWDRTRAAARTSTSGDVEGDGIRGG